MVKKPCTQLTAEDFKKYPVWEYLYEEYDRKAGATLVEPVAELPLAEITHSHLIGLRVRLADGDEIWACLQGMKTGKLKYSEQFLSIAVEKDGQRFVLERYFDHLYEELGPDGLAKFLGKNVDDVFPISYDVQPYVRQYSPEHTGIIPKEPRERLTHKERRELS